MQEIATNLLNSKLPALLPRFSADLLDATDHRGDLMVTVKPGRIREVIQALRDDTAMPFNMMIDLFGMDYLKFKPVTPERYAVIYNLYSLAAHRRVLLKAYLPEGKAETASIHDIYQAANWFEREAWDLFGIVFQGHPNLIRILTHNEFVGHPMRKDYPSDGYQRLKSAAPSTGI